MTGGLVEWLGLGSRELIAIVGAGGKSTLVATLGAEYAASGHTVILTTTAKMGADQLTEPTCVTTDLGVVEARLVAGEPLFVVADVEGEKVIGVSPDMVDTLFVESRADVVVVESDGARRKRFKAPAAHEPVIPSLSTSVVVVAGASALGRPIREAAHRPEIVAALADVDVLHPLTPAIAAKVLVHPLGGAKNVPEAAALRYVVTATPDLVDAGRSLADEIRRLSPGVGVYMWTLDGVDVGLLSFEP